MVVDAEGEMGELRRRGFPGEGKFLGVEGEKRSRLTDEQRRIRSLRGCGGGDRLRLYALGKDPRMRRARVGLVKVDGHGSVARARAFGIHADG